MLIFVCALTTIISIVEVRLVDGKNECQGRLEIMRPGATVHPYGQACNLNTGINETMVVCRQLGCNPDGATSLSGCHKVAIITYSSS